MANKYDEYPDSALDAAIADRMPELMDGWAEVRCFTGADDLWTVVHAMERRGFWWRINRIVDGYAAAIWHEERTSVRVTDKNSPGRAVVKAALLALEVEE